MSINYVIATYNGSANRKHQYPSPDDILKCHIEKLKEVKHNLKKITVMKGFCPNPIHPNYYNINLSNLPAQEIEVENYGYSMGQWLKAYELDKSYDYYLLVEDDYCPNIDNFDNILINLYNSKFYNKIGILCSTVEGSANYADGSNPIHFEGIVFVSRETMEKLYNKWQGETRRILDLLDSRHAKCFDRVRKKYLGGYYQLSFSHLFTLADIRHEDYRNEYNNFYWDDNKNDITIYTPEKRSKNFKLQHIQNAIFVPVQISNPEFIRKHTGIKS